QVLQLMKAGDIEFCISAAANAATLSPQAGVMSLHFLFRSEDHLKKALADPKVVTAVKDMIEETVQGGHVLALITLGLRNMYSKKEIRKLEDMKGLKVRVQATATEDAMFPAYGAQTVHMPFGSVYTSLQTGVVDVAENGVNVYLVNKHYEVAPVLSMTEHEGNNNFTRTSGHPWLWLQEVTQTFFIYGIFIGTAVATRRNDHLYLTVVSEALHGVPRLIAEIMIRVVVLGVALCLVYFGYENFLRGFSSFRMPSLTPIASLYAAIPISGALIALFTVEQLVNGWRNGFDRPPEPFDIPEVPELIERAGGAP